MARMLRTDRGLDRLVNFSDATVAIAITLLLLPLVEVASEISDKPLREVLGENWATLLAFFVSFFVIARIWSSHHRIFEAAVSYSPLLLRVNFVWLACIAFLPFSSNLVSHAYGDRGVYALYIGTMTVSSLTLTVMGEILLRDRSLVDEERLELLHPIDSRLTLAALALSLLLAVLFPDVGLFWLLLLVPAGRLSAFLERRSARRRHDDLAL